MQQCHADTKKLIRFFDQYLHGIANTIFLKFPPILIATIEPTGISCNFYDAKILNSECQKDDHCRSYLSPIYALRPMVGM